VLMHRGMRFVARSEGASVVAARSFTQRPYATESCDSMLRGR